MQRDIEFSDNQIRAVWQKVFKADTPESLATDKVFEACLAELGGEFLRRAIKLERE